MNTNKVKDPPHLGFSQAEIEESSKKVRKLARVIEKVENTLNICTSTPSFISKGSVMDIAFSKHQHVIVHDNDSGYMSQNQESNSESVLEGFPATGQMILSNTKAVYLSEDALLERPDVESHQVIIEPTDQKEFGSNERIESSVASENGYFNVSQDTSESGVSDLSERSIPIPKIDSIIVTDKCANDVDICDISNDSNIENNINALNISNNSITSVLSSSCLVANRFDYKDKVNGLLSSSEDLNNKSLLHTSFTSSGTTSRPQSPELFSDEEIVEEKENVSYSKDYICKEKYILEQDQKLIKNVQSTLSGVLPPPSLTSINLTAEQILERIEANKYLFSTKNFTSEKKEENVKNNEENKCPEIRKCLLLTSSDIQCTKKKFPDIMEERYHGLHHNRSKLSENFEMLCMKYAERYIGSETQSTCTVFQQAFLSSPLKRKANRLRWAVKSPGRRLSHLARRRITFSSANLQTSAGTSALNAHTRQIAMDSKRFQLLSRKRSPFKKSPRKTPKKSPRKSPKKKIRTPSSSAKKRLSLQLQSISSQHLLSGPSSVVRASATKRALFQSPEKPCSSLSKSLFSSTSGTSSLSPFKRRTTPKCALFTSPSKKCLSKIDNKRKRTDSDDIHPSKLFRSVSLQGTGSTETAAKKELSKVKSESNLSSLNHSGELSAHHKKKLQWAVYEALRGQNIGINHPQFKQFASVLARITRRFLPNLAANAPRPEGGTSDRMLRIARQHIFAVMRGKSVDEIIQDFEINRLKSAKPVGYIGLEAPRSDISSANNKENVFRDRLNTMSIEKRNSGLNRNELIKTTLTKFENRIDRARRMINFDDENNSDIR